MKPYWAKRFTPLSRFFKCCIHVYIYFWKRFIVSLSLQTVLLQLPCILLWLHFYLKFCILLDPIWRGLYVRFNVIYFTIIYDIGTMTAMVPISPPLGHRVELTDETTTSSQFGVSGIRTRTGKKTRRITSWVRLPLRHRVPAPTRDRRTFVFQGTFPDNSQLAALGGLVV